MTDDLNQRMPSADSIDSFAGDLLQWAQDSPRVGNPGGADLLGEARIAPPPPPQLRKSRSRPNKGRMKRSDRLKPILAEPPWDLLRETGYPIPPDLKILQGEMPFYWRRGGNYFRWRADVFVRWGTVCHLCKHEGADSADHLIPLALWANQPYDARISRPAHGVRGCAECGLKCNSSRGHRALAIEIGNYKPPITL